MIKRKFLNEELLRNSYRNGKFSDVLLCTDSLSVRGEHRVDCIFFKDREEQVPEFVNFYDSSVFICTKYW